MSTIIYYFTGTGNSYHIAKNIAEGITGELIPIASIIEDLNIPSTVDSIGIVFPIYYADIPNIIYQFAKKLSSLSVPYIFMVCTYGGGRGNSVETLREALNPAKLSAIYAIHMPQNAFQKPMENKMHIRSKADEMIPKICDNIRQSKEGFYTSDYLIDVIQRPLSPILKKLFHNYFIKTNNGDSTFSRQDMIYRLDKTFHADEKCIGCGLCEKVCPVYNIILANKRPVWQHHCENCIACYNFCPQKAIRSGIVGKKEFYYLHPEYSVEKAQKQILCKDNQI